MIFPFDMIIGIKTVNCILFIVSRVDNTSVSRERVINNCVFLRLERTKKTLTYINEKPHNRESGAFNIFFLRTNAASM